MILIGKRIEWHVPTGFSGIDMPTHKFSCLYAVRTTSLYLPHLQLDSISSPLYDINFLPFLWMLRSLSPIRNILVGLPLQCYQLTSQ